MAEVVFVGTGNAFCAGQRTNLALLLEHADFRMLIESGPMIIDQLSRVDLQAADIEQLFISHAHGDHVLGFPMLALNRIESPSPLHVYAGANTVADLQILGTLTFSSLKFHRLNIRWHELSELATEEAELAPGVTLRTAVMAHPPGVPTLAARWDFDDGTSFTFVTDTRPCEATVELAQGSDLLAHESSYSAELQPGEDAAVHFHSTAQQAGEIARQAGCRRLALVHLGPMIGQHPDVLIEEARAGTDLDVIVPEDGERVSIADR